MNPNHPKVLKVALLGVSLVCTGCSSTDVTHTSCDFVVGATESEMRAQQEQRSQDNETNLINGILNVITGLFTRAVSDNKDTDRCNSPT
ncbi:hypothetical protein [Shewanella sedimentimangrovi]|uniref:Lipoprotein n=1 Tax=Shewanella sedimentimangrovi TaxID=2814293 RepID=A0ABX7QZJ2_9GAMM|nr:hypothetical protein [Shewanella sedimentimangrovi]QSX36270.1 hypothetical protein JYB85_13200 [Shewanella sedimentimangrovi]